MAERLITTPPNARPLVIPHEYLAICQRIKERKITRGENKGQKFTSTQTDECAAALLYFFERWTIWRIKDQNGKPGRADVWLFFSIEQIEDYEFGGAFGRHRITEGIELLIKLGFLTRRNNPDKRWDQTYQYHFEKDKVQEAVNKLPPFSNIEDWKIQNWKMQSSKLENAKSNIEHAIPHDPEQSPKHDPEKDSFAPPLAGAESDESKTDKTTSQPLPEKKKRAVKVKTLSDLDPVRRVIAIAAHKIKPDQVITGPAMIRINMANAELRDRFPAEPVTEDELYRAFVHHSKKQGNPAAPKDPVKMGDMVQDYRESLPRRRADTPAVTPEMIAQLYADERAERDNDLFAALGRAQQKPGVLS